MFGWLRAAKTCASRLKRATRSGSARNASGSTLSATSRFSLVSRARYTFYEVGGCQVPLIFSDIPTLRETPPAIRRSGPPAKSGDRVGGGHVVMPLSKNPTTARRTAITTCAGGFMSAGTVWLLHTFYPCRCDRHRAPETP